MGSILSESLGFGAITKDDLLELGFRPFGPTNHIFGEPYEFKIDLAVFEHPGGPIVGNKIVDRFQLIVTFPRACGVDMDGDPVAVLTRKLFIHGTSSNKAFEWELDNKNAVVELDCDLGTLTAMMDEKYLISLI